MNYVIIKAGGCGSRVGGNIPKQFIKIKGKPIIAYTIKNYQKNQNIDKIIIVCHKDWIIYTEKCCHKFKFNKVETIISGGKTSLESIKIGIDYIIKKCNDNDVIFIQDANRPFTSQRVINDVLESCKTHGGVICSIPCTEEIVKLINGKTERLNFRELYRLQTPEAYIAADLKQLFMNVTLEELNLYGAVYPLRKAHNKETFLCNGALENLRITTNEDLELVKRIIK